MKKDLKICLPLYKIIYSLAFALILSLIRGVAYMDEIGGAMEPAIAMLTIVFCSDTYLMEVQGRRGEVFHLYEGKRKMAVILRRLAVQILYLIGVSIVGYGFFVFFKKPVILYGEAPAVIFTMFMVAMAGTVLFWSVVSMTICNLWRNVWAGIGTTLVLWLLLGSQVGEKALGKWNIFSYMFCPIEQINSLNWLYGEIAGIVIAVILMGLIPAILKKRG